MRKSKKNKESIIIRKPITKHTEMSLYGRLSDISKCVAYCKLHKCYLEPYHISEKKCNYKKCKYLREI